MIAEDEVARAHASSTSGGSSILSAPVQSMTPADEDEEMWDAVMTDFPDEPYVPLERQPGAPKSSAQVADEDEMWNIVREMEAEAEAAAKSTTSGAPASNSMSTAVQLQAEGEAGMGGVDPTRKATKEEGWDEMYA